jgi:hypothetical protein
VLVAVGVIGVLLAWNPPPLIGLFAQKGVYGLAAASLVPVLFGVLVRRHIPLWVVMGAAGLGLGLHLLFNLVPGRGQPRGVRDLRHLRLAAVRHAGPGRDARGDGRHGARAVLFTLTVQHLLNSLRSFNIC